MGYIFLEIFLNLRWFAAKENEAKPCLSLCVGGHTGGETLLPLHASLWKKFQKDSPKKELVKKKGLSERIMDDSIPGQLTVVVLNIYRCTALR